MKRAHIITCLDQSEYLSFIQNGFAGLYPIAVDEENTDNYRALSAKVGTNWDVIADLKRVKPGDLIFLHTKGEGKIYGVFEATTFFKESNDIPLPFKSSNLNIEYWAENYEAPEFDDYPWRIGIKSIPELSWQEGVSSLELFKLKSIGLIQSIPERFIYHDKPKIVKPLLNHETEVLIKLLREKNSVNFIHIESNELDGFIDINLNLSSYGGELYREKLLEAWLMEHITNNGNNLTEYENITSIFGEVSHFANSIFTYYANFLDVLFYKELSSTDGNEEFCNICSKYTSKNKGNIWVVELKKGWADINTYYQIKEYGDWALKALANNISERLKLCIIAKGFSADLLDKEDLILVEYELLKNEPFLTLNKIAPHHG